jgi:tRNA(Ile)-lysidine synthase TilS/MesJ
MQGVVGKCRVCGAPAYARLEYANLQLCRDDFVRFFERRVERTVERYGMFERGSRVAVAVSGGKDSVALLHSLWKLRGKLGVELVAITIDLGIAGHSDRYVPLARRVCERLGVPCRVVDLRGEYGFSVDELRGLRRPVCSLCGAVKRYVLNREARELGAHVLATGHNLDDFLAALLQAYIRGDLRALAKLRPYLPPEGKLVARAKPLVETPERDTKLYVEALGLEHVTWKCPYSSGASSFEYKRVLDLLEGGTRASSSRC